jgi:D-3-phosphoglycerate dehydrogenase
MDAPVALVHDLVAWVAERPRTYRETMDAWRTSCPKLPVWEDAIEGGLIASDGLVVSLTDAGRAFLRTDRSRS